MSNLYVKTLLPNVIYLSIAHEIRYKPRVFQMCLDFWRDKYLKKFPTTNISLQMQMPSDGSTTTVYNMYASHIMMQLQNETANVYSVLNKSN